MHKIGGITGLETLEIPFGWEQHALALKSLRKLNALSSGRTVWGQSVADVYTDQRNYHHFYRLLVDEQKRSVAEASKVLGILRNVHFVATNISEQLVPYLNKIDAAETLNLGVGELPNDKLVDLQIPSGVKSLTLRGNPSPSFLEKFTKLDSIEHFSFHGIKQPSLHQFGDFNELKTLEIRDHHLGDQGLSLLDGFKKLEQLRISDCTFGKYGLSFLAKLNGLKKLHLRRNQLSDVDLSYISALKELETLTLEGEQVPLKDSDLTILHNLKRLNQLRWEGTQTTVEGRFGLYKVLNLPHLSA